MYYYYISAVVSVAFLAYVQCYLDTNGLCTQQEMTCSRKCSSVAYCPGEAVMPLLLSCYGETPYCNQGKCTHSYNPYCNQPYNPLFYCPEEDGTYPDPLDCTKFHICLKGIPYTAYCNTPGLVFSTETLSCVRQSSEHQCGKAVCAGNGTWAIYSSDQKYAFFCVNSLPTVLKHCNTSYVFNTQTEKCEFKCPKEGLFQDDSYDPSSYIECSLLYGSNYVITKRNCPNDEHVRSVFEPETSQCVRINYNYTTAASTRAYFTTTAVSSNYTRYT
uniref:Putative chitin binding peritrophin-a domain protein n=1 Tax=Panstrongylus lignarius TaxID=156445 RepID=A0A224XVA4_9HEMI